MKTKEELNALKEEVEALNKKLAELNEEELKAVTGGGGALPPPPVKIDYIDDPWAYILLTICPYCGKHFGNANLEYAHEPVCPLNPANK